jgi:hypothetical protein
MSNKKRRMLKSEFFPMGLILVDDEDEFESIPFGGDRRDGEKIFDFPNPGAAVTLYTESQKMGLVIFVAIGDVSNEEDGEIENILPHEAVHVFDFTMEAIEEDDPGCEIKAYGITYFARYLIKEFYYRHPEYAPVYPDKTQQEE